MDNKNSIESLNILRNVILSLNVDTLKISDVLSLVDYIDDKFEKIDKTPDKQVYCGDIVVLSIDGDFDHEYFIANSSHHKMDVFISEFGHTWYDNITWDSSLGEAIIGRYVGEVVKFYENDAIHTAEIVYNYRTEYSKLINVRAERARSDNDFNKKIENYWQNQDKYNQDFDIKLKIKNRREAEIQYRIMMDDKYPCFDPGAHEEFD